MERLSPDPEKVGIRPSAETPEPGTHPVKEPVSPVKELASPMKVPVRGLRENSKSEKTKSLPYKKGDKLSEAELLAQGSDWLRKYAANHLGIVGASKVRGGMKELIKLVMQVRNNR